MSLSDSGVTSVHPPSTLQTDRAAPCPCKHPGGGTSRTSVCVVSTYPKYEKQSQPQRFEPVSDRTLVEKTDQKRRQRFPFHKQEGDTDERGNKCRVKEWGHRDPQLPWATRSMHFGSFFGVGVSRALSPSKRTLRFRRNVLRTPIRPSTSEINTLSSKRSPMVSRNAAEILLCTKGKDEARRSKIQN